MFQYSGYQRTKQCFIKTRKPESIQCFSTQDTNGKNSVSSRQGNLNQFNVSVLRIATDKTVFHQDKETWINSMFQYSGYQQTKQCFIKTRKHESIQCFSTQDTNGKGSVSLRQWNLKQFNVSVLDIPMETFENTVFHNSKEICTAIQCLPCRNVTGYSILGFQMCFQLRNHLETQ